MIKVVFFGTPHIASCVLKSCIDAENISVKAVVTQPDKKVGRKQILTPSSVKKLALEKNIPIHQPEKIRKNEDFFEDLRKYNADVFVVIAYGKILPKALLEIPRVDCLNLHGSILPKYRWAAPIQYALLHGEKKTGVTLMHMSEGMDEWGAYAVEEVEISEMETSKTLFEKFSEISGPFLVKHLPDVVSWKLIYEEQDHEQATYTKMIEKEDGNINWNESSKDIYQKFQAYTPWPGIYTNFEWKKLSILSCVSKDNKNSHTPGTVYKQDAEFFIACGTGSLEIRDIQLEGKKPAEVKNFLNGYPNFLGSTLKKV